MCEINIGKKIRKVRIHSGMSQQELADRLGTTNIVISNYERGKAMPDYERLIELAGMFNVSTDYLLSFGDEYLDERFEISPTTADIGENNRTIKLYGRRMGIGDQIRKLREERGLKSQELADGLSLPVTIVRKYENDLAIPSYETLLKIARYFNVTTEKLLGIDTGKKLDIRALPEDKKAIMRNLVAGMR